MTRPAGPGPSRTTGGGRRLSSLAVVVALLAVVFVIRLVIVQVVDGARYSAYSRSEQLATVSLPATRGTIYDRYGNVLSVSVPRVDVIADDFLVSDAAATAQALAPVMHLPEARLAAELHQRDGYVVLARQVSPNEEQELARLGVPGLSFSADDARLQPGGDIFQPVLGGVYAPAGTVAGDAGAELAFNRLLTGRDGSEVIAESPSGLALPGRPARLTPAREGDGLVLSLDEPLQVEVTRDVAAEMRATGAKSGVAVVMAVHTGAILAMVDLVRAVKGVIVPATQNLAVTSVYEPGSVMKLATVSFAIQDGVVTPSTVLTVPYSIDFGGYSFADAEFHPTERLSVAQILAQSSNVGTSEVAERLGPTRLSGALGDLGFGKPTGLAWPGESSGLVPPSSTWSASSLPSLAIGTGEAVTPLQILDAYAAVANGGVAVTPHLLDETVGANGVQRAVPTPKGRRLLDASTVSELVPMFEGVVESGTAPCASVPGYDVAGKTGTAQMPKSNGLGYVPNDFNATFVGFVPAQRPQLAAIVTLNDPQPIYGGSVAAPVFSKVMAYALAHYDIPPPPGPVIPQVAGPGCSTAQ